MPTLDHEHDLIRHDYHVIAGIDEAGRGCWAGPVVAAAVVLGDQVYQQPDVLDGVDDSKQLSAAQRDRLCDLIQRHAQAIGVGVVGAHLIDCVGIVGATRLAMEHAVLSLPRLPDALLIDALTLPTMPLPQRAIIRGDSASLSIAAASIIAKTTRDRLMQAYDRVYPTFGFGQHKGYGTALHARMLAQHGATTLHRRSFRPLWNMTEEQTP